MPESREPRAPHAHPWVPHTLRRTRCGGTRVIACVALALCLGAHLGAQTIEQVTFEEAVRRAVTSHPTLQQAAAGILRAEAVLQQVRSRSLPSVEATFSTNVIDPVTRFSGASINPRTQTVTSTSVSVPLLSPVRWAERHQAEDGVLVSRREQDEARRAVAIAAGEAYLAIITQRRLLDLSARARDNARTHYEFADQRYQGGIGSRLNALRAQQELSGNEARVEEARLAIRRAQEALGVLVAADGPVDAAGDPVFNVAPVGAETSPGSLQVSEATLPMVETSDVRQRADVRLLAQRQLAAERVANDAWKAFLPSVSALFSPTLLAPAGLFANARSWRASVLFSVPLFDSGQRRGQARERQALVDVARAERLNLERQAASEIRTAREAVAATRRALDHARAAAGQADEVVRITDVAFREGATTNIEVIDAQRGARDADTTAAIAEDAVRRAQLELLVATGQFP